MKRGFTKTHSYLVIKKNAEITPFNPHPLTTPTTQTPHHKLGFKYVIPIPQLMYTNLELKDLLQVI